jgi:hypothetical protein
VGFSAAARADFVIDTSFLGGDQLHITTAVMNSTSFTGDVKRTADVGITTIGHPRPEEVDLIKPDGALLTSLTFDPVGDTFTNFNFRGNLSRLKTSRSPSMIS